MLSRRALVGRLAVGAAAAWVGNSGFPRAASARGLMLPGGEALPEQLGFAPPVLGAADMPVADVVPSVTRALEESGAAATAPPWELVRPLRAGSAVAHGWRVADLSAVSDGSCVLTLQNGRGRTQRVHVCRNAGRPQGLVYTERFDLVVMNGGQGDLPTEEGLAQAVGAVAHVLAANDSERHAPVVVALLPQGERVRRFGGAMEHKLR